jgi:hypothetical protein
MADLEDRLRALADDHADRAQAPGVAAAIHRGRQRRRRMLGAATATILVLVAGLVGTRHLLVPGAFDPVAPPTTSPCITACIPSPPSPRSSGSFDPLPANFRMIASGDQPGYRWRLAARSFNTDNFGHPQELIVLLQRTNHPNDNPTNYVYGNAGARLSLRKPSIYDAHPNVVGIVTNQTARIRLWIEHDGAAAAPIDVQPIDAHAVLPDNNLFVAFVSKHSTLRRVDLLDRHGMLICYQRMKTVTKSGKSLELPTRHPGSCLYS